MGWEAILKLEQESHEAEVSRLRQEISNLQEENRLLLENKPVYAIVWSRDCDCCEATHAQRWGSERQFQNWRERFYEGLEGPGSVTRCSKEEYKEFEASTRDLALEAFEDGRGSHVLI